MNYLFYKLIVILFFVNSCNGQSNITIDHEQAYKLIRDNLYEDNNGNLYFKTFDRSKSDTMTIRYIDVIYSESFGVDGIKKIKDVVDKQSFRYDEQENMYKDKNNQYVYTEMIDGGTLSILE